MLRECLVLTFIFFIIIAFIKMVPQAKAEDSTNIGSLGLSTQSYLCTDKDSYISQFDGQHSDCDIQDLHDCNKDKDGKSVKGSVVLGSEGDTDEWGNTSCWFTCVYLKAGCLWQNGVYP